MYDLLIAQARRFATLGNVPACQRAIDKARKLRKVPQAANILMVANRNMLRSGVRLAA